MADFSGFTPSYQDYVQWWHDNGPRSEGGDGPAGPPPVSETQWNSLADDKKWGQFGYGAFANLAPYGDAPYQSVTLTKDDPRYQQYAQALGASDGSPIVFQRNDPNRPFDPNAFPVERFKDPNQVLSANGVTAYSVGNETPEWWDYVKKNTDFSALPFVLGFLGLAGGAALGAFGGLGEGSTAGIAATDAAESGGTLGLNAAGTATTPYMGAATGAATAGDAAVEAQLAANGSPYEAGVYDTATGAETAGSSITSDVAAADGLPAELGAPATGATGATTGTAGTAGSSTGIVDAARGAVSGVSNWYSSLSPGARLILGTALSQGASGALAAARQRQALDAQNALIQQNREDTIRRHYVAPLPANAFTPYGIIDGQRNGG